jgi:hypothetical protein
MTVEPFASPYAISAAPGNWVLDADVIEHVDARMTFTAVPVPTPRRRWTPTSPESFIVEQLEADGKGHLYIGIAPDRRTAVRMRAREAFERGVPESQIVLTRRSS